MSLPGYASWLVFVNLAMPRGAGEDGDARIRAPGAGAARSRLRPPKPGGRRSNGRTLLLLLFALALGACASVRPETQQDPLEPLNRAVFGFNRVVDGVLVRPAGELYGLLPSRLRAGVGNVLDNLREPVVFVNELLQGQRERAGIAFARFFVNTTLGIGGLFDVASSLGLERREEDFGQTLAVWGVPEGPYLVLPLIGPSSPRDLAGSLVDSLLFDPFNHLAPRPWRLGRSLLAGLAESRRLRPLLEELERGSLDFYAAVRSSYRQRRARMIRDGRPLFMPELYEIYETPEEEPRSAP